MTLQLLVLLDSIQLIVLPALVNVALYTIEECVRCLFVTSDARREYRIFVDLLKQPFD